MFDYDAFRAGIRYYRKKAELTQETLSEKLNIEEKSLSRIERGKARPSLDLIVKLYNALHVGILDCMNCDREVTMFLNNQLSAQIKKLTPIDKQFLCQVASSLENFRESGAVCRIVKHIVQ